MVTWRAYYTNSRSFDSATDSWIDLPDDGFLILILYYEDGSPERLVLNGEDYYWHIPDTDLYGASCDDPAEIRERYSGAVIKRGIWTTKGEFYDMKEIAYEADPPCR